MDFQNEIKVIVKFMRDNNLSELDINESSSDKNSVWGKICVSIYGKFDKAKSLTIYSRYIRNSRNFKADVQKQFTSDIPTYNLNSITMPLTIKEWRKVSKYINKSKRKKFLANFSHFVSAKLQSSGVNCYLTFKHNWFSINNSNWKGVFKCIHCTKVFQARITRFKNINSLVNNGDDHCVDISVDWYGDIEHVKVNRTVPCKGKKRIKVAEELIAKGTDRYRSEVIIHKENFKG